MWAASLGIAVSVMNPIQAEFRGVWVATVDNIDWPSRPGLPVDQQQTELDAILEKTAALNQNAVLFQVRPSADAVYKSALEPSSWYVTGKQGAELVWDPLEYAVKRGHELGLEVHAWLNPYRAVHPAQKGPVCDSHLAVAMRSACKTYGKYQWMDPSDDAVKGHTEAVVNDILKRYDVDGIHIDDYFYPYPVTSGGKTVPFPDSENFAAYKSHGGTSSLADWRRGHVDDLVARIHRAVKKKPGAKFGISPFGIMRTGEPRGVVSGLDQYNELYADVQGWLRKGMCDYLVPQVYWKLDSAKQPFAKLADWWSKHPDKGGVKMTLGLYTSQCSPNLGNWPARELADQIEAGRRAGASGFCHFSARALMNDWNGVSGAVLKACPSKARPWAK